MLSFNFIKYSTRTSTGEPLLIQNKCFKIVVLKLGNVVVINHIYINLWLFWEIDFFEQLNIKCMISYDLNFSRIFNIAKPIYCKTM